MITTVNTLRGAVDRWLRAGGNPDLANNAVAALDGAFTNTDVVNSLGRQYVIRSLGDANGDQTYVYGIYADGELLLKYKLKETPTDADVEVLP